MSTTRLATNGKTAVGATDTVVLAADANRKWAVLTNDSDEAIYLGMGEAAVMNEGIRLDPVAATEPAGQYIINAGNRFTGAINAICASGAKNLAHTYSPV